VGPVRAGKLDLGEERPCQGRPSNHLGSQLPRMGSRLPGVCAGRRSGGAAGCAERTGLRHSRHGSDQSQAGHRLALDPSSIAVRRPRYSALRRTGRTHGRDRSPGGGADGGPRRHRRAYVYLRHYRRAQGCNADPPQLGLQHPCGCGNGPLETKQPDAFPHALEPHAGTDRRAAGAAVLRGQSGTPPAGSQALSSRPCRPTISLP
jgi:hypothetical protein